MIAEIFGYAIVIALLVGLAAVCVEHLLVELRRPRRFAWLGAFAVALASPPLLWLVTPASPLPLAAAVREATALEPLSSYAQIDWDTALLWLWISTTTVLAILYVAAWLRLALQAKRWPRETTDTVSVVVANDVGPAVLGFLRPRIVLPRWLMDAPGNVRSTVVAHELEHIAVRDQACIVAAQIVTILLPWNLPLWWFVRQLRSAIEIDCDARVLRQGTDPAQYADVLLVVGQHGPASAHNGVTLIEPVTQLERRIRIMLTKPRSASLGRASASIVVAVALAACATQFEPPTLATSAAPPSNAAESPTRIDVTAADGVRFRTGAQGEIIVEASKIVMHLDPTQWRGTAQQANKADDSALFVGNVQLVLDDMSISASRAAVKREPDGGTVWTLNDAKVVRAATSAE